MGLTDHDKPSTATAEADLRKFGIVMAVAFGIVSAVAWWRGSWPLPWTMLIACILFFVGMLAPRLLAPLEKGWMALAEKLSVVMTLVILTVTFFVLITPLGLLRRLAARDNFGLRFNHSLPSYWKPVEPDGPSSRPDKPY